MQNLIFLTALLLFSPLLCGQTINLPTPDPKTGAYQVSTEDMKIGNRKYSILEFKLNVSKTQGLKENLFEMQNVQEDAILRRAIIKIRSAAEHYTVFLSWKDELPRLEYGRDYRVKITVNPTRLEVEDIATGELVISEENEQTTPMPITRLRFLCNPAVGIDEIFVGS